MPRNLTIQKFSCQKIYYCKLKKPPTYTIFQKWEKALNTLQSMDGSCDQLAIQIEDLLSRYEMVEIGEIIAKLNHGK